MEETEKYGSSPRRHRRDGEKLRRDRLNHSIGNLAQEIPWLANCNRRPDKTSILKLTVSYLKLHHGIKRRKSQYILPDFLLDNLAEHEMTSDGFFIMVTQSGNILYVSEGISRLLGHSQVDVIGSPIQKILHAEDQDLFKLQFESRNSDTYVTHSTNVEDGTYQKLNSSKKEHCSFIIRIEDLLCLAGQKPQYREVQVNGHIQKNRKCDSKKSKASASDENWLVGMCRFVKDKSLVELSPLDDNRYEWVSQHAMDGKLWFQDQRVALILGVLPSEVTGTSVYELVFKEDLKGVAVSHMKIMTDEEIPSTIFRLETRDSKFPMHYIQSRSVIVKDAWTKKHMYIVSLNQVLSKEEGAKLLLEQEKRYTALVAATRTLTLQASDSEILSTSQPSKDPTTNINSHTLSSLNGFSKVIGSISEIKSGVISHDGQNGRPVTSCSSAHAPEVKSEEAKGASCDGKEANQVRKRKQIEDEESSSDTIMSFSSASQENNSSVKKGSPSLLKNLLLGDSFDSDQDSEDPPSADSAYLKCNASGSKLAGSHKVNGLTRDHFSSNGHCDFHLDVSADNSLAGSALSWSSKDSLDLDPQQEDLQHSLPDDKLIPKMESAGTLDCIDLQSDQKESHTDQSILSNFSHLFPLVSESSSAGVSKVSMNQIENTFTDSSVSTPYNLQESERAALQDFGNQHVPEIDVDRFYSEVSKVFSNVEMPDSRLATEKNYCDSKAVKNHSQETSESFSIGSFPELLNCSQTYSGMSDVTPLLKSASIGSFIEDVPILDTSTSQNNQTPYNEHSDHILNGLLCNESSSCSEIKQELPWKEGGPVTQDNQNLGHSQQLPLNTNCASSSTTNKRAHTNDILKKEFPQIQSPTITSNCSPPNGTSYDQKGCCGNKSIELALHKQLQNKHMGLCRCLDLQQQELKAIHAITSKHRNHKNCHHLLEKLSDLTMALQEQRSTLEGLRSETSKKLNEFMPS